MNSASLTRLTRLTVLLAVCGCAGNVNVDPLLRDFDRYDDDLLALAAHDDAMEALEAGREKRTEAGALADRGKGKEALPIAEKALADAHLALEMERMHAAALRAEACRVEVERSRTKWREAIFVLEQTEEFVGTKATISRRAPEPTATAPTLPASTLTPGAFPPTLAETNAQWSSWRRTATENKVAAADLESTFEASYAITQGQEVDAEGVAHHTYLAARAAQALECRIRAQRDDRVCRDATELMTRFGDARADVLRATLGLEKGLQANLRRELDQLRAEAQTRQDELYGALSQLEGKFASIRRDARGTIVSLADILFDFDKATLKRSVEFNLVKIATILNQFEEMGIIIEGHTDSVGTDEYNLDLSKRRANAVYDFLVSQDVEQSRMRWEGYGETRPVADNETEEGRQRNRRVDLVIQDAN